MVKTEKEPAWHRRLRLQRSGARVLLSEEFVNKLPDSEFWKAIKLLERHHGSQIPNRAKQRAMSSWKPNMKGRAPWADMQPMAHGFEREPSREPARRWKYDEDVEMREAGGGEWPKKSNWNDSRMCESCDAKVKPKFKLCAKCFREKKKREANGITRPRGHGEPPWKQRDVGEEVLEEVMNAEQVDMERPPKWFVRVYNNKSKDADVFRQVCNNKEYPPWLVKLWVDGEDLPEHMQAPTVKMGGKLLCLADPKDALEYTRTVQRTDQRYTAFIDACRPEKDVFMQMDDVEFAVYMHSWLYMYDLGLVEAGVPEDVVEGRTSRFKSDPQKCANIEQIWAEKPSGMFGKRVEEPDFENPTLFKAKEDPYEKDNPEPDASVVCKTMDDLITLGSLVSYNGELVNILDVSRCGEKYDGAKLSGENVQGICPSLCSLPDTQTVINSCAVTKMIDLTSAFFVDTETEILNHPPHSMAYADVKDMAKRCEHRMVTLTDAVTKISMLGKQLEEYQSNLLMRMEQCEKEQMKLAPDVLRILDVVWSVMGIPSDSDVIKQVKTSLLMTEGCKAKDSAPIFVPDEPKVHPIYTPRPGVSDPAGLSDPDREVVEESDGECPVPDEVDEPAGSFLGDYDPEILQEMAEVISSDSEKKKDATPAKSGDKRAPKGEPNLSSSEKELQEAVANPNLSKRRTKKTKPEDK